MATPPIQFADYSGAPPILVPVRILPHWQGFYLPAEDDESADLELPEGGFDIWDEFDFDHPRTDYERACALGGTPEVQTLPVGPGHVLVFATMFDPLTWWPERLMLVNGGRLPDLALLPRVEWSEACVWQTGDTDFVLMNACEHGADPDKEGHFNVRLDPGEYLIQVGEYGWADDDPALLLFQFVPRGGRGGIA